MVCRICNGKGEVKYKEEKLCKKCFSRIIEKRIRKNARVNKLFTKGDKILVMDELCGYFVDKIIKGLPVKIFKRKRVNGEFVKKNKINKIVVKWSMDDEIVSFLNGFFSGKKKKKDKKVVKLLRVVGDDELKKFCKINKIKFDVNKKDESISDMVRQMNEKYPDTKEKLLRTVLSLEKMGVL